MTTRPPVSWITSTLNIEEDGQWDGNDQGNHARGGNGDGGDKTIWNYLKLFETIWKNHWTKSGHKLIVLKVVNRAYKVELGNEGVAFKSGDRSFVKIAEMFH